MDGNGLMILYKTYIIPMTHIVVVNIASKENLVDQQQAYYKYIIYLNSVQKNFLFEPFNIVINIGLFSQTLIETVVYL